MTTMQALIQERADAYMRHCVAGVTKGGKAKGAAFAICKAGGNKAGYYQPGTKKQTAKGQRAIRAHSRDQAAKGKDAAYDRAIKSEDTMGNMRQMIGQLVERVEIPVSGDAGAIAKKISDDIAGKIAMGNVYVVAKVRDQKGGVDGLGVGRAHVALHRRCEAAAGLREDRRVHHGSQLGTQQGPRGMTMTGMRVLIQRLEEMSEGPHKVDCKVGGFNYAQEIHKEFGGVISPSFPDMVEFPSLKAAEPAIAKINQILDDQAAEKAQEAAKRQGRRARGRGYSTGRDDAGRGGGGMGF